MNAEEDDKIAEEERLKAKEYKSARLKVEEEFLLSLEVRRQAEEADHLQLKAEE